MELTEEPGGLDLGGLDLDHVHPLDRVPGDRFGRDAAVQSYACTPRVWWLSRTPGSRTRARGGAARADVLKRIQIRSNRFRFEPEITVKVAKLGYRIYEVPISYHGRTYAEGKEIGWRGRIASLYLILRYRLFD